MAFASSHVDTETEVVASSAHVGQHDLSGRRRWGQGAWSNDISYWTFEQYLQFVKEHSAEGVDVFPSALKMWNESSTEESELQEKASRLQWMKEDVRSLCPINFEDLKKSPDGVVLEFVRCFVADVECGTSLRVRPDGVADANGGAGTGAMLSFDVVDDVPTLQVKIKSFGGTYLQRANGTVFGFAFKGGWQDAEVFELLPRAGSAGDPPYFTLAVMGGSTIIGDFKLRRASVRSAVARLPLSNGPWAWGGVAELDAAAVCEELARAGQEVVDREPMFRGYRRHMQDQHYKYYSFIETLFYVQQLFKPQPGGAMVLARAIWEHACVPDYFDEEWVVEHEDELGGDAEDFGVYEDIGDYNYMDEDDWGESDDEDLM